MTQTPQNSVWSAMDYKPPKGRCNHKASILTSCPCLRFMLHPVKAATSFDCDGCGHHASFHSLENPIEDAILKKWSEQETKNITEGPNNKRRRIADIPADEVEVLELSDVDTIVAKSTATTALRKRPTKQAATRPRPKVAPRRNPQMDLQDTLHLVGS